MIRLGFSQPAHRITGALLDSLCRHSTRACALLDPGARVVASSSLFAAVADREARLGDFLADAPRLAASAADGEAWLDDGWLVASAAALEDSALTLVHLYGPAVVRVQIERLYPATLSGREGQCLALALEGAENSAVAARIGVRPETVKVHLRNAYRKLGAGGRADILARLVAAP